MPHVDMTGSPMPTQCFFSHILNCQATKTAGNKYSTEIRYRYRNLKPTKQLYLQVLLYFTSHVLSKIFTIFLEKIITNFYSRDLNNFIKYNFIKIPFKSLSKAKCRKWLKFYINFRGKNRKTTVLFLLLQKWLIIFKKMALVNQIPYLNIKAITGFHILSLV